MLELLAKITLLDCLEEDIRYHEPQKWVRIINSDFSEILFKLQCQSADMWLYPCPSHLLHKSRLIPQIWLPMMRTMHEGSSWQAPWHRRGGSINAVRFSTSSKSGKNWNSKQSRIQFSIHYFITLGEVSVINTLSHIWAPEAPMKLLNLHPDRSTTETFTQWAPII